MLNALDVHWTASQYSLLPCMCYCTVCLSGFDSAIYHVSVFPPQLVTNSQEPCSRVLWYNKHGAKWVRLSGHIQLTWETSTAISSCPLPPQQDMGPPTFHIMSTSPRQMPWISHSISNGTKCRSSDNWISSSSVSAVYIGLRCIFTITVGVVVSTSGTIHEAHQNSWEGLKDTLVSFIICRPPGKAALTITKWQFLSLQQSYHCFGFLFNAAFPARFIRGFSSFLRM